tara:strand:+ start:1313 stop:2101 length:789 start_codon:yes stop_codon:yes gene_type:complete
MKHMASLAFAPAVIQHRRFEPKRHEFTYKLKYLLFDPDQIEHHCEKSPLWSSKKWNLLALKPTDFLADYQGQTIRDKLNSLFQQEQNLLLPSTSEIRVLALPRCFGYAFNSVVFYFIFEDQKPIYIVSEITNTPWGEKKAYIHACTTQPHTENQPNTFHFDFQKEFHVSPFMPMNLTYQWHFHLNDDKSIIYMKLLRQDIKVFDAKMEYSIIPATRHSQQHWYALMGLFQPVKMLLAIYWQALRLWLKRIPFFTHPSKKVKT